MNSKPLTYDSMKTVIQYMEPNTRFLLSSRSPSIRLIEKLVPLKVDELVFGGHFIKVNQKFYDYGVYHVDIPKPRKIFSADRKRKREEECPEYEIQISFRQGNSESFVIERVEYTGDLKKAPYSLMKFMFANRRHVPQVNKLRNAPSFPMDFKIRFRSIILWGDLGNNLEKVEPIIDESSFPLEKFFIDNGRYVDMDHEIIKTSKILEFSPRRRGILWLIHDLSNQTVKLDVTSCDFFEDGGFIRLIKHWVETDKPLGTCFMFRFCAIGEESSIQILNYVSLRIDGAVAGDKCVDIPMNNDTVLKISYERSIRNVFLIKMNVVDLE
uniref:F-box domain-containing protein n=1 Tax=Caenorhabditis tropicalis TaxID=1561998 RepID=A0A1I7UDU2_9PELO